MFISCIDVDFNVTEEGLDPVNDRDVLFNIILNLKQDNTNNPVVAIAIPCAEGFLIRDLDEGGSAIFNGIKSGIYAVEFRDGKDQIVGKNKKLTISFHEGEL